VKSFNRKMCKNRVKFKLESAPYGYLKAKFTSQPQSFGMSSKLYNEYIS